MRMQNGDVKGVWTVAKIQSDRPSPYLSAEQRDRLRARLSAPVSGHAALDEIGDPVDAPVETESATEPEQPVVRSLPDDWEDMTEAPVNRPIFLTADPATDQGLLCYWRTTREKNQPPLRGWSPKSFWASVLTKREVEFVPACWREAMVQGAVALQAVMA